MPASPHRPRWLTVLDQVAVVVACAGMVGLFTGTRTTLALVALCVSTALLGVHFIVTSRTAEHRVALRELRQDLDDYGR